MAKKGWRRWLRVIHRDVGYTVVGLTLIYALSGVAVNHNQDWNPNFVVERTAFEVGDTRELSAAAILRATGASGDYKSTFKPDPRTLQIFAPDANYTVDLPSGRVVKEVSAQRAVFYESNFLHLNTPKGLWTWVADVFAVALAFLAVSGAIFLKGEQGFAGRGKWFMLAGAAIPLGFLLWAR